MVPFAARSAALGQSRFPAIAMPIILLRYLPHIIAVAAIGFGLWQVRQAGYRAAESEQLRQHVIALAGAREAAAEAAEKHAATISKLRQQHAKQTREIYALPPDVCLDSAIPEHVRVLLGPDSHDAAAARAAPGDDVPASDVPRGAGVRN